MASFAKLLRHSKFVRLGEVNGRTVVGRIVHRVNDDLYIDFDCKFNAVCKRPERDAEKYVIGQRVVLRLFDTELSQRFLGSKHDLTLLEADARLLGLFQPAEEQKTPVNAGGRRSDGAAPPATLSTEQGVHQQQKGGQQPNGEAGK